MTISSEIRKAGPYTGNGVTDSFPFTFKIFATSDVLVTQADLSGVESVLSIGPDISVYPNSDQETSPGGYVDLTSPLPFGYKLTLTSRVPVLQPIALTNAGGFYPDVLNNGLDRATIQIQQIEEKLSRAAVLPVTSSQDGSMFLSVVSQQVAEATEQAELSAAHALNSASFASDSYVSSINSAASAALAATSVSIVNNRGIDLRIGLDHIYGAGLWSQHSGVPGSGSDIGPALTYVLGLLGGRGDVIIPVGSWRMATPPSAALLSGKRIIGQGSQGSGIVYDANTGVAFFFSGASGFTGGGILGLSIHLESGYASSTAQAIRLEGDATYQPDQMVFEDIYISALGASYWNSGFFAYGNARTSPQGIRVCTLKNIQVFRCNATGIYISNTVQFSAENIGVYVGTGGGANIYIAGGGTGTTNSVQLYIRGATAQELNVTNTSKFEISGTFSTFATGTTATAGRVLGFGAVLSGTLGANVTLSA